MHCTGAVAATTTINGVSYGCPNVHHIYSRGSAGYDGRCITKLVMNFRSHPALLRLPARLFYSDELKPFAKSEVLFHKYIIPYLTEE